MSEFEKLAQDLEILAKSQVGDDKKTDEKIAAAADDAGAGEENKSGGEDGGATPKQDEDEELLGKSFEMERDGEKVKVFDATAILKSMSERLYGVEAHAIEDESRREHLGKSLGLIADMLKSQAEEIASLKKSLADLGNDGRGRKTVLTVTDKPTPMVKSQQPAQETGGAILAKCLSAQRAGKLTAHDVARANVAVESGIAVPDDILARLPE